MRLELRNVIICYIYVYEQLAQIKKLPIEVSKVTRPMNSDSKVTGSINLNKDIFIFEDNFPNVPNYSTTNSAFKNFKIHQSLKETFQLI